MHAEALTNKPATMHDDVLALLPLWIIAFLFSLSAHEAAHALAAKIGGDRTAYILGQVTINPAPHIQREPIGMIVFPLVTYFLNGFMMGWASAPLDPNWIVRNPKPAAWVALAGPLSNLGIALIAALIMIVGVHSGYFNVPQMLSFTTLIQGDGGVLDGIARLLSIFFSLNVVLFAFNLIPLPPLDGASVLGLFVSEKTALQIQMLAHNPQFSFIGIILAWYLSAQIISPVYEFFVRILLLGFY